MEIDRNGLAVLTLNQCLRRLLTAPFGRLALTVDALPVVLPVDFALSAGHVLVCCGGGPKVAAALDHSVVAFEIDGYDEAERAGWSVLVQGIARLVDDPADLAWLSAVPGCRWPSDAGHVAAVTMDTVSGRRLDARRTAAVSRPAPRRLLAAEPIR